MRIELCVQLGPEASPQSPVCSRELLLEVIHWLIKSVLSAHYFWCVWQPRRVRNGPLS